MVANLATTDAVDAMAARHGCPVFRTRVGEANVAEGMRLHRAVIGGEGNGGVIWPAVNFARDSLVGMGARAAPPGGGGTARVRARVASTTASAW